MNIDLGVTVQYLSLRRATTRGLCQALQVPTKELRAGNLLAIGVDDKIGVKASGGSGDIFDVATDSSETIIAVRRRAGVCRRTCLRLEISLLAFSAGMHSRALCMAAARHALFAMTAP